MSVKSSRELEKNEAAAAAAGFVKVWSSSAAVAVYLKSRDGGANESCVDPGDGGSR